MLAWVSGATPIPSMCLVEGIVYYRVFPLMTSVLVYGSQIIGSVNR